MSGVNSKCDQKSITGGSSNDVSAAVGPRAESLPPIFKLNVDCFEDLFEWLSLEDLKKLRRTCKRMKQVIDYYIKLVYTLRETYVDSEQLDEFHHSKVGRFGLVNHITCDIDSRTLARIKVIKKVFGHVECIDLCNDKHFKFKLNDDFLKHFTHLKHLMIRGYSTPLIENGNEWMLRKYPTLEHIGIGDFNVEVIKCTELEVFFEQNSNVRTFSTSIDFLLANQDWILESNIRLERLDIWDGSRTSADQFGRFSNLLDKLHERKFYKRLHLYHHNDWFEGTLQIRNSSLRAIERLALFNFSINELSLSFLNNIKELIISNYQDFDDSDLQTLANNLANVQRVRIVGAPIGTLLPFIRGCPRLRQIRISGLKIGTHFKRDIIDLVALNNERAASFPNARKMTIFIPEDILLKNKWKQNINLRLIELERASLWEEFNPFYEF